MHNQPKSQLSFKPENLLFKFVGFSWIFLNVRLCWIWFKVDGYKKTNILPTHISYLHDHYSLYTGNGLSLLLPIYSSLLTECTLLAFWSVLDSLVVQFHLKLYWGGGIPSLCQIRFEWLAWIDIYLWFGLVGITKCIELWIFTSPNEYLLDRSLGLVDKGTDCIPHNYIWWHLSSS